MGLVARRKRNPNTVDFARQSPREFGFWTIEANKLKACQILAGVERKRHPRTDKNLQSTLKESQTCRPNVSCHSPPIRIIRVDLESEAPVPHRRTGLVAVLSEDKNLWSLRILKKLTVPLARLAHLF